tara:strand:+ start:49678 stop:51168 length:1491 start_codon:yes stop_codon:yes gene_type:complete
LLSKFNPIFLLFLFAIFVSSILCLKNYEEKLITFYEEVDGTPTVITKSAKKNGELIVLAHGFAGSTSFMRSLAVSLASAGHTTIRFDFLGHGKNGIPFSGNVRDINGPTIGFIAQLNAVIDHYKKKYKYSEVSLIGHSMASDIIIRSAKSRNDIKTVIGISTYSNIVPEDNFPHLLVLNGEWESNLIKKTDEIFAGMGFVNPRKNQTYISRVSGNERRMEVIEGADHVGILYFSKTQSSIKNWFKNLGFSVDYQSNNQMGIWLITALSSLFFIVILGIKYLPTKKVGTIKVKISRLVSIILFSSITLPIVLSSYSIEFLEFPVQNYLLNFFLFMSLSLYFFVPFKFSGKFGDHFSLPILFFLTFLYLFCFGGLLDNYVSSYFIDGDRLPIFLLLLVPCVLFFSIVQMIYELGEKGWYLANLLKFSVIISLSISVYLNFQKLFLLGYAIVIFLAFCLLFGFLSNFLARRYSNFLSTGFANGIVLAWSFSSAIPLYAH